MRKIFNALLALLGLAPSGEGEQAKVKYIVAWFKGVLFGLAAVIALTVIAGALAYLFQVWIPGHAAAYALAA